MGRRRCVALDHDRPRDQSCRPLGRDRRGRCPAVGAADRPGGPRRRRRGADQRVARRARTGRRPGSVGDRPPLASRRERPGSGRPARGVGRRRRRRRPRARRAPRARRRHHRLGQERAAAHPGGVARCPVEPRPRHDDPRRLQGWIDVRRMRAIAAHRRRGDRPRRRARRTGPGEPRCRGAAT